METQLQQSENLQIRLHNAARRYCMERHAHWCSEYDRVRTAGRNSSGSYEYSEQDLRTFPRYNVLAAILEELERLKPETISTLNEARELFIAAGQCAESVFTKPPNDDVVTRTMAEERETFCGFITKISEEQLIQTSPLFYRRVLSKEESSAVRGRLKADWGVMGGYFFPLKETRPKYAEAFLSSAFESGVPLDILRRLFEQKGINHVFEIREYGADYEMEISAFEPCYNGAEGFWTSKDFDWLIYASHESSVTVAGEWLLDSVKSVWPSWKDNLWSLHPS